MSEDLNRLFEMVDANHKGHLTVEEIQRAYELVQMQWVEEPYVHRAMLSQGLSTQKRIPPDRFGDVLKEMHNLKAFEEEARWTFFGLANGDRCVSVEEALFLFQACHDDRFSLQHWGAFLAGREEPSAAVTFDEIKFWLVLQPTGSPESSVDLLEERKELRIRKADADVRVMRRFTKIEDDKSKALRQEMERVEHESEVNRIVQRKLDKWQENGVRALMEDDGTRWAPSISAPRHKLAASDLLDLLRRKYNALRDFVLQEMLHAAKRPASDLASLRLQERDLRHSGTLKTQAANLPGAAAKAPLELSVTAGGVGEAALLSASDLENSQREKMAAGKTKGEAAKMQSQEFRASFPGSSSLGDLIIAVSEREVAETSDLRQRLLNSGSRSLAGDLKLVHFCLLEAQLSRLQEFPDNLPAALSSLGLGERSQEFAGVTAEPLFSADRGRQEAVARWRLEAAVAAPPSPEGHFPSSAPDEAGRVDLLELVLREMVRRNKEERQVLLSTFLPTNMAALRKSSSSAKDPNRRLKQLQRKRTEWKKAPLEVRRRTRQDNQDVLKEALAIRWSQKRSRCDNDVQAACALLADVQQKQDEEFHKMLRRLITLTNDELRVIHYEVMQNCANQAMDATAQVVVGGYELSVEEEIVVHMVDKKYDALRIKILQELLLAQHGLLPNEERHSALAQLQKKEEALRNDGDFEGLGQLLKPLGGKAPAALAELLGPELRTAAELRKACSGQGAGAADYLASYRPAAGPNVAADLATRQEEEVEFVLKEALKEQKTKVVVHYFIETLWASGELNFAAGALAAGLMERVEDAEAGRPRADRDRCLRLASARIAARKTDPDFVASLLRQACPVPTTGDPISHREAIFFEVHRKHLAERRFLMRLLEEASFAALIDEARLLSRPDRQARLVQLEGERMGLDLLNAENLDRNLSIVEDAAALSFVLREEELLSSGRDAGVESVLKQLLVEVQERQDAEVAALLRSVVPENIDELQQRLASEKALRKNEVLDNAFGAFVQYHGPADDRELMDAVKAKYDALRDKALIELLMQEVGAAQWAALDEKERQRRLAALKLRERQLRKDAAWNDLARLLSEDLVCRERLRKMAGDSRAVFERKLRARREAAAKAKAGAEAEADSGIEEDEVEEGEEAISAADFLADLDARYEEEVKALLDSLHGRDGQLLSENERQALLLQLRRQALLAGQEERLATAARLLGLLERQGAAVDEKLRGDRARQEELAKQRLATRRLGRAKEKIEASVDRKQPKDNLLKLLDAKHRQEEALIFSWIETALKSDKAKLLEGLSRPELEGALQALKAKHDRLGSGKKTERHACLSEAVLTWLALEKWTGVPQEEVEIALLADLHSQQNAECHKLLTGITDWSEHELVGVQQALVKAVDTAICNNAANAIFALKDVAQADDAALGRAVEEKYDALRDHLLIEALISQMGAAEWARMSEEQRQRHLATLRLKERQLRRDGKLEELARLLGDASESGARLAALLGEERAAAEAKLRERLARRQQRLDEGMEEAEAERLMQEEEAEDEKEAAQRRKNVLHDLDTNCEKEKAELLARLAALGKGESAERERQRQLLALRREALLARREDGAVAAAMLLELVRDRHGEATEADRQRQEALARERLRLARSSHPSSSPPSGLDPSPSSATSLATSLFTDLENRHEAERQLLVALLAAAKQNADPDLARRSPDQLTASLAVLRREVADLGASDPAAVVALLEEAAAARAALLIVSGAADGPDAAELSLMLALQAVQLAETAALGETVERSTAAELRALKQEAGPQQNVARVLTGAAAADAASAPLVEALEAKFDAARDRLLLDGLMRDFGQARWAAMSERERQAELLKVKREARRLEKEGRGAEAEALLLGLMGDTARLQAVLGGTAEEQKARLDARRKQLREERKKQGLPANQAAVEEQIEQEEAARSRMNVLQSLHHNFEAELGALMSSLSAQGSAQEAERQRQLEVLRLRREAKALSLESADTAALLLLGARENEQRLSGELLRARERSKKLAAERLAAAQRRRGAREEPLEEALEGMSPQEVAAEAVQALEERHAQERELLAAAAEAELPSADLPALRSRLAELAARFPALSDAAERRALLEEAARLRLSAEARGSGCSSGEAAVSLMTELQARQDEEAAAVAARAVQLDAEALRQLVTAVRGSRKEVRAAALAPLLFDEDSLKAAVELDAIGTKDEEAKRARKAALEEAKKKEWKEGEEADRERALKEIEAAYRRQMEALAKERQRAMAKLRAQKEAREHALAENDAALGFVMAASASADAAIAAQRSEARQLQSQRTKELLEARRLARKRGAQEESEEQEEIRKRKITPASQRKRLEIQPESSEKKQQIVEDLLKRQEEQMEQIRLESERQRQLVKDAVHARTSQRQDTSVRVLQFAEAQKEALIGGRRTEEDRQRQKIQERVEKLKFERTMTQAARRKSSVGLEPPPEGAEKADYDRMMEEKAAQLQRRFEEAEAGGGGASGMAEDDASRGAVGGNSFNVDGMAPRASVSFASQAEMLQSIREQRKARRARKLQGAPQPE